MGRVIGQEQANAARNLSTPVDLHLTRTVMEHETAPSEISTIMSHFNTMETAGLWWNAAKHDGLMSARSQVSLG